MLSKWMYADPDVLILDEPTRGIDVGAKYEIYTIINSLADQGKGIVVISSELPNCSASATASTRSPRAPSLPMCPAPRPHPRSSCST
ncbi:hypothetical protein P9139_20015 [Curtobacterium flaccumfaciens]|nr:hypothetical protein P9139_20015 [Curtobacterium flaccumfaciens]